MKTLKTIITICSIRHAEFISASPPTKQIPNQVRNDVNSF